MRKALIGLTTAAALAIAPVASFAADQNNNGNADPPGGACTHIFHCPGTGFGPIFAGASVLGLTALAILLATSSHHHGSTSTSTSTATSTAK